MLTAEIVVEPTQEAVMGHPEEGHERCMGIAHPASWIPDDINELYQLGVPFLESGIMWEWWCDSEEHKDFLLGMAMKAVLGILNQIPDRNASRWMTIPVLGSDAHLEVIGTLWTDSRLRNVPKAIREEVRRGVFEEQMEGFVEYAIYLKKKAL